MSDDYEELQKKQLFAQRVTAASSVATAVAAHRAAASLEAMRQDALLSALVTAEAEAQHIEKAKEAICIKREANNAKQVRIIGTIVMWICRILGSLGCLFGIPAAISAISETLHGKAKPDDPGIGGIILGFLFYFLIFGGLAAYGFWRRKKKTASS